MSEEPNTKLGTGDGSVELTPLQLIRWIDTSPDLGYLRDAADRVQGRYDSTTGQITFQKPNVDTVVSQDKGFTKTLRNFFCQKQIVFAVNLVLRKSLIRVVEILSI